MAGGQWRMILPAAANTSVVLAANTPTRISPRPDVTGINANARGFLDYGNLLGLDRPTLMTEWLLSSLYLPVALLPSNFPTQITLTLELVLNGQVVWTDSQTPPVMPAGGPYNTTLIYSQDFVNPIVLSRGSRLALEGYISSSAAQNMFVAYGAIASATYTPREGSIGYQVRQLQGARQL